MNGTITNGILSVIMGLFGLFWVYIMVSLIKGREQLKKETE